MGRNLQQAIETKFACDACGKLYRWKPEIAGKKGKCSCGAPLIAPANAPGRSDGTIVVTKTVVPVSARRQAPATPVSRPPVERPAAIPPTVSRAIESLTGPVEPPHPPIPETTEDETYDIVGDDLAGLDSLIPSAEIMAAVQQEAPPPLPAQVVPAQALEYQRNIAPAAVERTYRETRVDPETGELLDPMRDYIAPSIILALGLAGIAAHMIFWKGIAGPFVGLAISILLVLTIGFTAFKTVVLVIAAFPLADRCDVGLGLLRSAILKLAATILFGDVAILWLIAILRSAGTISNKYDGGPAMWILYALILAVLYQFCFAYLFRLSAADVRFAISMSVVSRLCNLFLVLILLGLAGSLGLRRVKFVTVAPPPAISTPPVIPASTPLTANQNKPTVMDDLISDAIRKNRCQEGYAWCRLGIATDADKKLVSDLYNAGADKVMIDGFTLYAELPGDKTKRAACLDIAHAFRKDHNLRDGPDATSLNYQYAVISLMEERLQHNH
jgi:hypothetical protein